MTKALGFVKCTTTTTMNGCCGQARRQGRAQGTDEALEEGGPSVEHTGPYSVTLPAVEQRLRTRIDKFVGGYGLTPMGEAVARSWIQVGPTLTAYLFSFPWRRVEDLFVMLHVERVYALAAVLIGA